MMTSTETSSRDETILDRLERHAGARPDDIAFRFLEDGREETGRTTYGDLSRRARALADAIGGRASRGDRALLFYQPGLEFVAALLGALAAGVIAVPINPPGRRRGERIEGIVADCQPRLVLSPGPPPPGLNLDAVGLPADAVLDTSQVSTVDLATSPPSRPAPGDVAYLQYTSGSTGRPRGVVVTHGSLMANLETIRINSGYSPASVMTCWLPLFHDFGLVGGVFEPLFAGFPSILIPPDVFLRDPLIWLDVIGRYGVTTTGAPDFAFDRCVRRATPERMRGLDLSSLKVLKNGAEPVRARTLDRFAETFSPVGFRPEMFLPCYGLAEATLFVSGGPPEDVPRRLRLDPDALAAGTIRPGRLEVVSCGRVGDGVEVAIVGPEDGRRAEPGRVGEIWVRSESIARGYWDSRPDPDSAFGAVVDGQGPFLRTGDLGFVEDGELYVTGRLKDLVILNGRNLYPQDIEAVVEEAVGLAPNTVAAFALEIAGRERLGVAIEVGSDLWRAASDPAKKKEIDAWIARVRTGVNDHVGARPDLVGLVRRGKFPITSSGKVRRGDARQLVAEPDSSVVLTWRDSEDETDDERAKVNELIAWLRVFASTRLNSRLADERRMFPPQVVLELGNRGFFGLAVPRESGGLGLSATGQVRLMQQLAAIDVTLALMVGIHNGLGVNPLLRFARLEILPGLLPAVASGRELVALAVTESAAGSNPRAIEATAIRVPGGWELHAEKRWIGLGSWARWLVVLASARAADGRPLGMTSFLVDALGEGVRIGAESPTMGVRAIVQNRIGLDAVFVPDERVLGEVGEGMRVAQGAMMFGRLGLASLSIGVLKRSAQLMARYARRRTVAAGRLIDHPVTAERLRETAAAASALAALVGVVTRRLDGGAEVPDELFAACKVVAPELAFRAVDRLMQLLGGRGYEENSGVPQMFRDVRLFRIFEGPTEAMTAFLGASALRAPAVVDRILREPFGAEELASEVVATLDRLRSGPARMSSPTAVRLLAEDHAGRLLADAVLLAAARDVGDGDAAETASWAGERYRRSLRRLHDLEQGGLPAEGDAIARLIDRYADDIGEVEQELPGEEVGVDPLLRSGRPATGRARPDRPMTPEPSAPDLRNDYRTMLLAALPERFRASRGAPLGGDPLDLDSIEMFDLAARVEELAGVVVTRGLASQLKTLDDWVGYLEASRP